VAAGRIAATPADDLLLDPLNPLLETTQGFGDRPQAVVQWRRDALVCWIGQVCDELANVTGSLGDDDAELPATLPWRARRTGRSAF
jgi:hypothetical protein